MAFPSRAEYEKLIYGIAEQTGVAGSTLRLFSTSSLTAIFEGSVRLANGLELRVVEASDFKRGRIQHYSYTVCRAEERIRWYDFAAPPGCLSPASTFPHHRA